MKKAQFYTMTKPKDEAIPLLVEGWIEHIEGLPIGYYKNNSRKGYWVAVELTTGLAITLTGIRKTDVQAKARNNITAVKEILGEPKYMKLNDEYRLKIIKAYNSFFGKLPEFLEVSDA